MPSNNNPADSHLIVGSDADLVLLAMASPMPNVHVISDRSQLWDVPVFSVPNMVEMLLNQLGWAGKKLSTSPPCLPSNIVCLPQPLFACLNHCPPQPLFACLN